MSEIPLPIRSQQDTEGHWYGVNADAERAEGDQDGEGHADKTGADVQPPRDLRR